LVLFIYSFKVVRATYLSGQTSPAMQLPMWTVQISVTVSSLLSMIRSIQNLLNLVRGKTKLEQKDGVLYQK
ncbi:TRAP transporter small permease, partial [Fusobacterium nucleatum]